MNKEEKRFLSSLAALLAKMVTADDVVASEELVKVSSIWDKLGLNVEQREYCAMAFKIAQNDGVPFRRYVQEFVATRFGVDAREFLYALMWDVACADRVLHEKEKHILQTLPNLLGLLPDSYDIYYRRMIDTHLAVDAEIEQQVARQREKNERLREQEESRRRQAQEEARRRQAQEEEARRKREEVRRKKAQEEAQRKKTFIPPLNIDEAYTVLGCSPWASDKELKTAYRKEAMRWHPDRLRGEGIPQELIDNANEKMATLNAAWVIIKKHRKII